MEESLAEFRKRIMPKERKSKISHSWGVYDAYKTIRKNNWFNIGRPVSEKEFYTIVRSVNRLIADALAAGKTFEFPHHMGQLELHKFEFGVKIVDDKLKVTYPVDWAETWKLWYQDAEAMKNKILLRHENPWVYSIKYNIHNAAYNNKYFYQFAVNTFIKKDLHKNIKAGKIDALWS